MNLCWITASLPYSNLGSVLRNVAWEEEDYAYWEIIWNYRLGLSGFGIMLSKNGQAVESERMKDGRKKLTAGREGERVYYMVAFLMHTIFSF